MSMRQYYVYITSSLSRCLYIGVTNNIRRRMREHKSRRPGSFTARYRVTRLVYFESTNSILAAIAREKELKRWPRERKIRLIERENPAWWDLSVDWE